MKNKPLRTSNQIYHEVISEGLISLNKPSSTNHLLWLAGIRKLKKEIFSKKKCKDNKIISNSDNNKKIHWMNSRFYGGRK